MDSTGTTTYTWDFENRLTSVALPGTGGTVTSKYDPFGRRIYKSSTAGTSIYVYDGDNQIEEVNASGTQVARYTQGLGIDEPLAILRSATTSYYGADGLGSVTSLSNSSGANAATYTYDSFGNLTASTGTLTNPFRYTGREFDTETGLYFYRARYYDPSVGRFLSEDPGQFYGGMNFYSYVGNEPSLYVDPLGLLDVVYQVSKRRSSWFGSLWHGGETRASFAIEATCICVSNGKYQIKIKLIFNAEITYYWDSTLRHEEKHVQVMKDFFNRQKPRYEQFEKTYSSKTECDYFRQLYVSGVPSSGRIPDLRQMIYSDFEDLNSLQSSVDTWLDRIFQH